MKIYTVVVTYNGKKWVDECFGSLLASSLFSEIVVVDNNSSDDSLLLIQQKSERIKIIRNTVNLGFGAANNLGIAMAMKDNADYVFLLNQDAWIEKNTIETLANAMQENKNIGVISPIHKNGSNSDLDFNFKKYLLKYGSSAVGSYINAGTPLPESFHKVSFVNAAAWLMSKECINDVGGFDPLFYHYGEDSDYLDRVGFHGYLVGIWPSAFIYHDRENRARHKDLNHKEILTKRYRSIQLNLKNPNNDFEVNWRLKTKSLRSELFRNIVQGKKESIITFKLLTMMIHDKKKIIAHRLISAEKGPSFLDV